MFLSFSAGFSTTYQEKKAARIDRATEAPV
ncbi:hypothetical protein SAMN05216371_7289 [Streptomyces sp. TLI_053]|nr:hypothetical protein SAMN05216371_7289 [Streptomyces sp. TLI_053]